MFGILLVDDDPAVADLLKEVTHNLHRRHEFYYVGSGAEALDFLYCRGAYVSAARPNLVLLDLHMPQLSGLEVLTVIKNDPELYVIPVIMLSTSDSREDIRRSYEAHANCYVQAHRSGTICEIGSGSRGVLDRYCPPAFLR